MVERPFMQYFRMLIIYTTTYFIPFRSRRIHATWRPAGETRANHRTGRRQVGEYKPQSWWIDSIRRSSYLKTIIQNINKVRIFHEPRFANTLTHFSRSVDKHSLRIRDIVRGSGHDQRPKLYEASYSNIALASMNSLYGAEALERK